MKYSIQLALLHIGLFAASTRDIRADQYTLFLYESKADLAARTDTEKAPGYWGAYGNFAKTLTNAGILRGGTALYDDSKAAAVHLENGKPVSQTGAYAQAKSQLGGYFIIEVPNLADALNWAAKAPAAVTGAVEVRPNYPNPTTPAK